MIKIFFREIEDLYWCSRCSYNYWLHGPYGLAKVIEKMPFRFLVKYLRKYGATVGYNCRFERGLNIHRPLGKKPFENLLIGNEVYLGHNTLIDLTNRVTIEDKTIIASRCQLWTHASIYHRENLMQPIYRELYGEITIEEGAILYSGVIVSHGNTIGSYSKIGANSLVNKSITANQFWGGVPAKYIKPAF